MTTKHHISFSDACKMDLPDRSVNLVVTSPPYPMIAMWDAMFTTADPQIGVQLANQNGSEAHCLMLDSLTPIWDRVIVVLKQGGIAAIVIGDATRSIGDNFRLYSNHSAILQYFTARGFEALPEILWHKQSNKPNKFMGSGMLPPNAYVTQEHEYILILRKGGKRTFTDDQKPLRAESAYFWEERNKWFSDIWTDLKGVKQDSGLNERTAAYPFELAYRLINMFSVKGDLVLDPFLGTGTTTLAAMTSNRNSIGCEIQEQLKPLLQTRIEKDVPDYLNEYLVRRYFQHCNFIRERKQTGKELVKYISKMGKIKVMTGQEVHLTFNFLHELLKVQEAKDYLEYQVVYYPNMMNLNFSNKEKKELQGEIDE